MKLLLCIVSAAGLMLAAGCGGGDTRPPRHAVTGTVTSDDNKPLAKGRIIFQPNGAGLQGGGPIVDGKYALDSTNGPGVGAYKVLIYGAFEPPIAMDDPEAFTKSELKEKAPVDPIVAEYNTASKLSARISAGSENKFDFKVSTKPTEAPSTKKLPGGEMP